MADDDTRNRLEYLRGELRAERISYGELAELEGLAEHIEPGDNELLEAAGVPEYAEGDEDGPMTADEVTNDDEGTAIVMSNGLRIRITRVPLDGATSLAESKRTQLSVFISTEEMGDDQNGTPLMQVVLNDATLYDQEPTR